MNYIYITKENIDSEHICCAMSGKQSLAKKEWLKQRFDEGLVFYRSKERGKCFIEYIPAENAWVPIEADGWLYINCLWIAGSMKGHGYSNDLLRECIRDAEAQGRKGICILCAQGRKREFLADPKFLAYKGFKTADISDCGISLMYLPLVPDAEPPKDPETERVNQVAEKIRTYIRENYMNEISMQDAARQFNYSDAYFCKLFKQCFDQNFTTYLTNFRINEAKRLLKDRNISVKDAGMKVGYYDSNYFAKVFKRVTGMIPSEYREAN